MKSLITLTQYFVLLIILTSCDRGRYQLSDVEDTPLKRNDDNLIFKTGDTLSYSMTYEDSLGNPYYLVMNKYEPTFDHDFVFLSTKNSIDSSANILSYVSIIAQECTKDNQWNGGQSPLFFTYYDIKNRQIPFGSETGFVDNAYNFWMHPPRNSSLKVLNLSAYPYVKYPLEIGKVWEYTIIVDKMWGNKDFGRWDDSPLLFNHNYALTDTVTYKYNDEKLICYLIEAKTTSDLGNAKSQFIFHETYGFLYMSLGQVNNSHFVFKLIP